MSQVITKRLEERIWKSATKTCEADSSIVGSVSFPEAGKGR